MAQHNTRSLADWIPGLTHLRHGFVGAGFRYLMFTAVLVLVLLFRFERVVDTVRAGGWDALITLVVMLGLPVLLFRMARRSVASLLAPPDRSGLGTWQLAWRELTRSGPALWGLSILGLMYLCAALAPVLAPYDPNEPGAGGEIVHKLRAPNTQVLLVGHTQLGQVAANQLTIQGDYGVLLRQGKRYDKTIRMQDLVVPPSGWERGEDTVRQANAGGHTFAYRTERYVLGTDARGRDLLSRLLFGSRISLFIGFIAMFVSVTLGVLFGSLAGYFGGWVDSVVMRLVDILLAFPRLLLLLLIVSIYEDAGIWTVIVILGATGWMGVSRLVRAEFMRVRDLDYAHAARAFGFSQPRVMFRHLLPNCMAPVIVNATLLVGNTILVEAALSFLGFGVKPPNASWGNIISDGQAYLREAWWISTIPGLLIVVAVICINLAGDALRDALDPKSRQ